jgi:glycosyltransferase involved in cell wall biosynthesis
MGISDRYFKKINKQTARKKLRLNKNKKYILYLGRIKTTKGIKELLDAMKNVKAELILIGEGVDYDKYKKYVIKKDIKNVEFLGARYGEDKLLYLSACDCLILPSHTEGAPVVLMEAIAKNLPVISTNVGGVSKMIKDGREGKIIRVNSKQDIQKAIEKVLKWKNKNIKQYAEKYRWKKIIRDTFKDYSSS